MNNKVLIGATEVVSQYDGSGIFNPTSGAPETASEVESASYVPESAGVVDESVKPDESVVNTSGSNNGILLYGALALAAYFFFFKKK
jgi:hypothetical protein